MTWLKLELADNPFSGSGDSRSHDFLLSYSGSETDESMIDFVGKVSLWPAGFTAERPDGTVLAGLTDYPIVPEWDGRPLVDIRYRHIREVTPRYFEVTAVYEPESGAGGASGINPTLGEAGITYSFEIGPEQGLLRTSLSTVQAYGRPGGIAPPNMRQAINVQPDRTVAGTQPPTAPAQFSLSYTNSATFFTESKLSDIQRLAGSVNDASFRGHNAGEVRFLGATGRVSTNGNSTLEYRFGVIKNSQDITIDGIDETANGTVVNGIIKEGWDYLWVFYGYGSDANVLTAKPLGAYVDRLFPRADLTGLF